MEVGLSLVTARGRSVPGGRGNGVSGEGTETAASHTEDDHRQLLLACVGGLGRARCTLGSSGLARPGIGNPRGCHAEGVVGLFGDSVVGQVHGFRVRAQRQELDLEAPVGGPNLSRSSVCRPGEEAWVQRGFWSFRRGGCAGTGRPPG